MHPEKNSLSIQLIEPVVSLHNTSERASRRHDSETSLPPAAVRGLLTLTLVKPTKVASIELELVAQATTQYAKGAGPSRTDITEQYKVYSASRVIYEAGSASQVGQRSSSTMPSVQFLDNHAGSDALQGTRLSETSSGRWQGSPATRSASLDPQFSRIGRLLSSDDPAPPYHNLYPGPYSFVGANSSPSVAARSQSIASSSRIPNPQSSPILSQSSLTSDIPHGSSIRDLAVSRASSIAEALQDDDENFDMSAPRSDNIAYYGLSRITTSSSNRSSEVDRRGRSRSRLSLGKVVHIFDAVKDRVRSRSPQAGSLPRWDEQEERGRSLMKGKGKARLGGHGVGHALSPTDASEPSAADDARDQNGDGWVMFREGTYTYPILFTIPNDSPPTMRADHGSLIWKVKAEVKRPSAFKLKMTAQQEVVVVRLPKVGDLEEADGIQLQQQWDDQLQYRVQIAGRAFPIGGKMPFQLTIMPLAKIRVHSILVYLDERMAYYTQSETEAQSDAIRRATLLVVRHDNSNERHSKPILPLVSDGSDAFSNSPLYRFCQPEEDESEVASSFMGPGPWTIRHQLRVPDSCSILHPSNRTKGSNIMVNHTLKIVLRVEREGELVTNRRKKLYDIEIVTPIQVLPCQITSEWTSLPRYDEVPESTVDHPGNVSTCPCRTRQVKTQTQSPKSGSLQRVTSLPTANSNPSRGLPIFRSDSLIHPTHFHELLMRGLVSERGEAPPPYERVRT